MSKYINVNPGQYKTAGRERPNKVAPVRLEAARKTQTKIENAAPRKAARKSAKAR